VKYVGPLWGVRTGYYTYDKPPAPTPRNIWFQVARIREANGDLEGARQARQNARALPNQKMRKKFTRGGYSWDGYTSGSSENRLQEDA
jgi:hypothetical protein